MRCVLKPENERGDNHAKKQQRKPKRRLVVIPVLPFRRVPNRAERIRRRAKIQTASIQPNEQRANGLNDQRDCVAKELRCVVARHVA